jgi:UDP:flavonoid glycosyltransferase YjiC (YdhE family)
MANAQRQRTAFLVCELSGGIGHVMRLRRYALALRKSGWRIVCGLESWSFAHYLTPFCDEVWSVPGWPGKQGETWFRNADEPQEARKSNLLSLFVAGVAEPDIMANVLSAWPGILARVKPDIILADHAPASLIMGRANSIPTFCVGAGHLVPVLRDGYFLPVDLSASPDKAFQDEIRGRMMTGLWKAKVSLAQSDVFSALESDFPWAATLRDLDPVGAEHRKRILPPEIDEQLSGITHHGDAIYVYLGSGVHEMNVCFEWISRLPGVVRIYNTTLSQKTVESLQSPRVVFCERQFSIEEIRQNAKLLIHHGGMGISQIGALAGVPQIACYTHNERWINATNIQRMHSGIAVPFHLATEDSFVAYCNAAMTESGYRSHAEQWRDKAVVEISGKSSMEQLVDVANEN